MTQVNIKPIGAAEIRKKHIAPASEHTAQAGAPNIAEAIQNIIHAGRTFAELAQAIVDIHERKNHDYGNAFSKLFQAKESARKGKGLEYAADRIFEKANRVEVLASSESQVKEESVIDTLLDIAAYCLMTVEELEK